MRISRLYTDERLEPGRPITLEAKTGHYLMRVLKLRAGDPLVLFNGDGADYAAELLSNRRDRVEVAVSARLPALRPSPLAVTLVQAVGKGDRMDFSLQKATELGVAAVRPLFTERTGVRLEAERLEKRAEHWRRVMISACEQCGRADIPELLAAAGLDEWLPEPPRGRRLCLAPGAEQPLVTLPGAGHGFELVIGPEGGFSDLETQQMTRSGVDMVALGPRVLRTETAGPVAIAVLQALFGDLGA
ncbi:16S rRNA (uracil(1498)-N(3))-methyltransferase [Marinihelvus fidelis]|uniref:Ribosomal RNA small subunit methyltransferase E n=1 Tax=Marinihelvus fidelis TaxID=2613842 RepID=A0A5N0T7E4_9GAMM|nr:16S rRNA (uracil(1498)-N(3))-methyltransferase [Marinihelvus fidelis]KAA9130965.1 16S rRNA (uracil(1498)-N(3))-methyltransferase [Marinihelvus fidelis]